jgi:ADP-glucose pyrophosphorylase
MIHKVDAATMAKARKAGRVPKMPKKPKKNSSLQTMEAYIVRHNNWVAKIKEMSSRDSKKNALKKQIFGHA